METHDARRGETHGAPSEPSVPSRTTRVEERATSPKRLTRAQRVRRFGVDCADHLTWTPGWKPGGEYVQTLTIKNLTTKAVTYEYSLPRTKFFNMGFPEPIHLNPGLSKTLVVAFRPTKLESYLDAIRFFTDRGEFVVPVIAEVPRVGLAMPDVLDFGLCAIAETATRSLAVVNTGDVGVSYAWRAGAPFRLSPVSGALAPGASANFSIEFVPSDASVVEASCWCDIAVGGAPHATHQLRLGGIGKFPYVSASAEALDFGRVLVSSTERREFALTNRSLVPSAFTIARRESDVAAVFKVTPTSGVIEPDGERIISVTYSPEVSGTFSHDHYDLTTPGGNAIALDFEGEAVGLEVELSKPLLSFGDVSIELPRKSVSRSVEIINLSESPATFELHAYSDDIFHASLTRGVVHPRQPTAIRFSFSPDEPANYHKRVFLLVHGRAPLALDLFGSGYDEKRRPATMVPRHLWEARRREQLGLHLLTPDELEARAQQQEEGAEPPLAAAPDETEGSLMRELFRGSSSRERAVYFEEEYVRFGARSLLVVGEPRTVRLVNNTAGRLSVLWPAPEGEAFSVSPSSAEVLPRSDATFRVWFRPSREQRYFCQRLEASVAHKSMRTFRLVTEHNFAPPWTLALCVDGHTFPSTVEHFVPRAILSHPVLRFPTLRVGDTGFQTISVANESDTPLTFSVANDPSAVFHVTPRIGLIPAEGVELLAVSFRPPAAGKFERILGVVCNHREAQPMALRLFGIGARPALDLGDAGRVHCLSTCVGAESHAQLTVSNPTRLDTAYEIQLPAAAAGTLSVTPAFGILRGGQSVLTSWRFTPSQQRSYAFRAQCLARPALVAAAAGSEEPQPVAQRQIIKISGVGEGGEVCCEPEVLDFGVLLVSRSERRPLTIVNPSAVDLYFSLRGRRVVGDGSSDDDRAPDALSFSPKEGLVPARNRIIVSVELEAVERGAVEYEVLCTVRSTSSFDSPPIGPPRRLGAIVADAQLPSLRIVDARLAELSQQAAWTGLALTRINEELSAALSPLERQLNAGEGLSGGGNAASLAAGLRTIDVCLPPRIIGASDSVLTLLLRNVGALPAEWSVRYPTDMELQIEHWADAGETSADDLKQHMILDHRIMSASRKRGNVEPGDEQSLQLRMRHVRADEYVLPLLFQLTQGKWFVLNLRGRTLADGESCVHIPQGVPFALGPTPIGLAAPQVHTLELPNLGETEVSYELETASMEELNAERHGFPMIECLEPAGVVEAGSIARVPVRFHPVEAEDISLQLPLRLRTVGDDGAVTGEWSERLLLPLTMASFHPNHGSAFAEYEARQSDAIPPAQTLDVPSLPARLSLDTVRFGILPRGATANQIVLLHSKRDVPSDYEWDESHPAWGARVAVFPSRGTLPPGGHVCCKVSLFGEGDSEMVAFALPCRVTPHTFSQEDAIENETSPASMAPLRRGLADAVPKPRGRRALLAMEQRKLRIAHGSEPATPKGGVSKRCATQRGPVTSTLLLDVRASVLPAEMARRCGTVLASYYIPAALPPNLEELGGGALSRVRASGAGAVALPGQFSSLGGAEVRDTCSGVVEDLLRELMDDPTVRYALETAPQEKVPWFGQLSRAPPPPAVAGEEVQREVGEMDVDAWTADVRSSAEMHELATYVLEGVLFNLMSEATTGEFSLTTAPRQIVQSEDVHEVVGGGLGCSM